MFKIAICDDEDFYRNHMYQMLTAYKEQSRKECKLYECKSESSIPADSWH